MLVSLKFLDEPTDSRGPLHFGKFRIGVADEAGQIDRSQKLRQIRLQLTRGGKVVREWTQTAVGGVATFRQLAVERPGKGYRMLASTTGLTLVQSKKFEIKPVRRHVIVLIADGWGYTQIEATSSYTKSSPPYDAWDHYGMSTWDLDTKRLHGGRGYSPVRAWSQFAYAIMSATDSAAAATAMFTGVKTDKGNINVSSGDKARLTAITEIARRAGLGVGIVTSVPASHATPGAWLAHNSDRFNGFAIADELLWGDPNTTGTTKQHAAYGGGWGATAPPADVVLAGGHPRFKNDTYINKAMRDKLAAESGKAGHFTFVERVPGQKDAAARLLKAAADPKVERLACLFGGSEGNLDYRLADGSGTNPENPTLAQMTRAALVALERKPRGFALMVEGGAVDWGAHKNMLDWTIGEMIDFNDAVAEVVRWVDDKTNGSSWKNTTVVVTGDHECGYLTAGPGIFPDRALGEVSPRTLKFEKLRTSSGRRVSWNDKNQDSEIQAGEEVYWAWNKDWHSNHLIPVYARGFATERFARHVEGTDPVRGKFVDNTSVFHVLLAAVTAER